MPDIQKQLAAALDIDPENILEYRKYADGYTVITYNFQKFTAIQPAELQPAAPAAPELPANLQKVYDEPSKATVKNLKALCKELGIPYNEGIKKAGLLEQIELYKSGELTAVDSDWTRYN